MWWVVQSGDDGPFLDHEYQTTIQPVFFRADKIHYASILCTRVQNAYEKCTSIDATLDVYQGQLVQAPLLDAQFSACFLPDVHYSTVQEIGLVVQTCCCFRQVAFHLSAGTGSTGTMDLPFCFFLSVGRENTSTDLCVEITGLKEWTLIWQKIARLYARHLVESPFSDLPKQHALFFETCFQRLFQRATVVCASMQMKTKTVLLASAAWFFSKQCLEKAEASTNEATTTKTTLTRLFSNQFELLSKKICKCEQSQEQQRDQNQQFQILVQHAFHAHLFYVQSRSRVLADLISCMFFSCDSCKATADQRNCSIFLPYLFLFPFSSFPGNDGRVGFWLVVEQVHSHILETLRKRFSYLKTSDTSDKRLHQLEVEVTRPARILFESTKNLLPHLPFRQGDDVASCQKRLDDLCAQGSKQLLEDLACDCLLSTLLFDPTRKTLACPASWYLLKSTTQTFRETILEQTWQHIQLTLGQHWHRFTPFWHTDTDDCRENTTAAASFRLWWKEEKIEEHLLLLGRRRCEFVKQILFGAPVVADNNAKTTTMVVSHSRSCAEKQARVLFWPYNFWPTTLVATPPPFEYFSSERFSAGATRCRTKSASRFSIFTHWQKFSACDAQLVPFSMSAWMAEYHKVATSIGFPLPWAKMVLCAASCSWLHGRRVTWLYNDQNAFSCSVDGIPIQQSFLQVLLSLAIQWLQRRQKKENIRLQDLQALLRIPENVLQREASRCPCIHIRAENDGQKTVCFSDSRAKNKEGEEFENVQQKEQQRYFSSFSTFDLQPPLEAFIIRVLKPQKEMIRQVDLISQMCLNSQDLFWKIWLPRLRAAPRPPLSHTTYRTHTAHAGDGDDGEETKKTAWILQAIVSLEHKGMVRKIIVKGDTDVWLVYNV